MLPVNIKMHFGLIPVIVLIFAFGMAEAEFTEDQLQLLEDIKEAAEESGLANEEKAKIDVFHEDVCYEDDCLHTALEIMQAVNFSVDPCQNGKWLDFVCGRKENSGNQIAEVRDAIGVINTMMLALGSPYEEGAAGSSRPEFLLQEAKVFYNQCNEKQKYETRDVQDILHHVEQYGGWPMFSHSDPPKNFSWMDMVADENRLERVGYAPMFFHIDVQIGTENILLEIGRTSFPHTVQSIKDYESMVVAIQRKVKLDEHVNTTQVSSTLKYMTEFNERFVDMLSQAESDHSSWSNLTLSELQVATDEFCARKACPGRVDWRRFFERVFTGTTIQFGDSSPKISLPFEVVMGMILFVNQEMASNSATGREAIVNALHLNLVTMLMQETTLMVDDLMSLKCTEESGARYGICFKRAMDIFGYSLGKTFINNQYDDARATPEIHRLMNNLKSSYRKAIGNPSILPWMSTATKKLFSDRIKEIGVLVAQPDWMKEEDGLRRFYAGLNASREINSSYPENFLNINAWQVAKKRSWAYKLAELTNTRNLSVYDFSWNRYLGSVNAMYYMSNQIRIDAGIIQQPLFGLERPGFNNYGGLGSILAHELGHTMDTTGRKYDKLGSKSADTWDKRSSQKYDEWVTELTNFYKTMDPNGNTIDEDIADLVAVYISFHAYEDYLKGLEQAGKKEKVLPGLTTLTPQKLFFMKYGNTWCESPDADAQSRFAMLSDKHSPGSRRATVPLMRSQDFKSTFQCPT